MRCFYLIPIVCSLLCTVFTTAQELTNEQKEDLKYKVTIFTSDNKELQHLWYEDRMDEMKLKGKLREDYSKIVSYHALKMEQLKPMREKVSNAEMRAMLQKQLALMDKDVREILDDNQYEIHQNSWEAIIRGVILKEGLDTN